MQGLRPVLSDIAQVQAKLATALIVNVTLAESKECVTRSTIVQKVVAEVPAARELPLWRVRHHLSSITNEGSDAL